MSSCNHEGIDNETYGLVGPVFTKLFHVRLPLADYRCEVLRGLIDAPPRRAHDAA